MDWESFFIIRDEFLLWLEDNTETIDSILSPTGYLTKNSQGKHYIRHICYLSKDNKKEFYKYYHLLVKEHKALSDSDRIPSYLPNIMRNIEQINITQNAAISSKTYDIEELEKEKDVMFPIKLENEGNREEFSKILQKMGVYHEQFGSKIRISLMGLINHFKVEKIKLRYRTGIQHIARTRGVGGQKTKRNPYGLIVCIDNQPYLYHSLPTPTRTHKGKGLGRKLEIPLSDTLKYVIDIELFEPEK